MAYACVAQEDGAVLMDQATEVHTAVLEEQVRTTRVGLVQLRVPFHIDWGVVAVFSGAFCCVHGYSEVCGVLKRTPY